MTKGKHGIVLPAIAVAAYALAILDLTTAFLVVVAFAVIAEKDEWLTRQVLQAFIAWGFVKAAAAVINLVFGFFAGLIALPYLGAGYGYSLANLLSGNVAGTGAAAAIMSVAAFINGCLWIALALFLIFAGIRVLKGKEADMPLFAGFAERAMGTYKPKPKPQYPQPPVPYQQYPQPPAQAAQPIPPAPPAPPAPAAKTGWVCPTCGSTNSGAFCAHCGKQKPESI